MKVSAYLLLPFSVLYGGITRTRNWLYDQKLIPSRGFSIPVINVGNLTVGGTGKTPHVEYLIRLLQLKNIAILSRGYKRTTKGFVLANADASPATIGDEPFQYTQSFPGITVAVCEDRVNGINQILKFKPRTEVILLDDAFQHRPVQAHLNILLTDYNRLFYQDFILPAGRLREARTGAQRADIIIVSKSPTNLAEIDKAKIRQQILTYSRPNVPVFFTTYRYQVPISFGLKVPLNRQIILLTGIAQPQPLINYLAEQDYFVLKHFDYPDHYAYTQQDMLEISNFARTTAKEISIITTQKDWTKLSRPELASIIQNIAIFYVPIEVHFLENKTLFEQIITATIVKV